MGEKKGKLPKLGNQVDYVVAAYNKDMLPHAMTVANKIRAGGKSVDMYQGDAKKAGKAFNYADRVGADRIAFVAPDEWNKGFCRIKDLRGAPELNSKGEEVRKE